MGYKDPGIPPIKINPKKGTGSYGILVDDNSIRFSRVGDYIDNAIEAYKQGFYSEFFARSYALMIRIMKLIIDIESNNVRDIEDYTGFVSTEQEGDITKGFKKTKYFRDKSVNTEWLKNSNIYWSARNDFVHQLEPFLFSSYSRNKSTGKLDKKKAIEPTFENREKVRDWCINEIKSNMSNHIKSLNENSWNDVYLMLLSKKIVNEK